MDLPALLARPGLSPAMRRLVLAIAAIWHGDWPRLAAVAGDGRAHGQPRAAFEETLLQAVLFCGFPRVVTAFGELDAIWPPPSPPVGGALPTGDQSAAGRTLFAAIYGRNDEPVRAMLRRHHGELHDFVLDAAYGRILTRPGLSAHARELLATAALAAQGQVRQFVAHARGAIHFGSSVDELAEVLHTVWCDEASATCTARIAEWLRPVAARGQP